MPSPMDAGQPASAGSSAHVALIGQDSTWLAQTAALLESHGHHVLRAEDASRALALLRDARLELAIVDGAAIAFDDSVCELIDARQIPVLAVLDAVPDPSSWLGACAEASDWVLRPGAFAELPARVRRLLNQQRLAGERLPRVPANGRFFSLVIHDLRTPLNVIGLSLRMISQSVPKGDPDLDEDLRFVEENFKQIERMLAQLSDYFRLLEGTEPLDSTEFSPQRLVDELLENRAMKPGAKGASVRLDVQATCPRSVALDQIRARLGLQYALANALVAAGESTVRVTLRGEPGRWITEIATDRPAPGSVQATELHSHVFERLCGTAAERRGMDLAIAARVTELLRGTARLDVTPQGTTLVFDWPTSVPDVGTHAPR